MPIMQLQAVCDAHPSLTAAGLDLYMTACPSLPPDSEFTRKRDKLLRYPHQFDLVVAWLEQHPQARTVNVNRLANSYNWKHVAEAAVKAYVPNGVFIAAALHVGLVVDHIEGTDNAYVNLSQEFMRVQRMLHTPCYG